MPVRIVSWMAVLLCLIGLTACMDEGVYAPVTDISAIEHIPNNGAYRVRSGDTLYSIAWRYGLDYRYVAQRNNIAKPYLIEPGQLIYLRGQSKRKLQPSVTYQEPEPQVSVSRWNWPARGPVIGTFSEMNKGVNIGGAEGDPVFAAAPGKIVYSGNGLRAYGNLIIIKHNSVYLSAYAHNQAALVKEGDWVKSGQKIAEMGNTGTRRTMLHFEIRRGGKPLNPLGYLAQR